MLSTRFQENKWEMALSFGTIYGIEEASACLAVLNEWAPTANHKVREFEKKFAEYVGGKYAVAANSWVGAAHLLAIVMELKPTDEIIVPAMTFQATANVFYREGAKIVFADTDPYTYNIDPADLEEKITPNTKAIVVVHMCGQPCNMDPILQIARKYQLPVIQDAAHAPGAEYKGKKLAELSDFVIYSFQQGKNMSTLGDGGIIVTNNKEWADHMRRLRGHGTGLYIGISSRMTDLQASVGIIQLSRLEHHNATRRMLAYYLKELLKEIPGLNGPVEIPEVNHVYHIFNVQVDKDVLGITRDELLKGLWKKKKIMVGTQYSPTVNCLPAYKNLGYGEGLCPVAEKLAENVISLPISPRFGKSDMDELIDGLKFVVTNQKEKVYSHL